MSESTKKKFYQTDGFQYVHGKIWNRSYPYFMIGDRSYETEIPVSQQHRTY